VTAGLIVCVAALALATVGGLGLRWRNGRFRPVAASAAARAAARTVAGAEQAAAGAGSSPRSASQAPAGTGEALAGQGGATLAGTAPYISWADLGQPLGTRATLVQFSSAFCAPCRATRQILAEVAGMTTGVAHVEIDAESHLELVRRLDVRRTPTVFVLGPDGRIARRASGQPRKADLIAALGEVT
jgi:thiol-disulfide isomerase/thioredoxin